MSKRFDLSGKVALVTGASSGLGVHFARTLASGGASVAIAARRAADIVEPGLPREVAVGGAAGRTAPRRLCVARVGAVDRAERSAAS